MLHNCFYLPTPNPPPLLSITAPLHLPCKTRRRYILSFLFSALLSNSNKKVMAVFTRVRGNEIIHPLVQLMADVIKKEDTHHILQIDLRPLQVVVQDIAALQAPPEIVKIWLQLLLNSLAEAQGLLNRSGRRQRCLDWLVNNPRRQSQQIRGWNAFSDCLYHVMQTELPMLITSLQFLSSKPLLLKERVLLRDVAASRDGQPLSRDEAWMLFRRVAFKDVRVSMDIEERARIIADECRGRPLAINVVAASMIGQSSVEEWDNCFSSVKKVDPSFPPTHPHLDAELYRLLRWSYDSLPNSNVKNCFLYCALYNQGQEINSRELVEMWIGEGLIKSKQGAYSMDMAIGRSYVKLLLHRSLFHIVNQSGTNVFRRVWSVYRSDVFPRIGVKDAIREMAMYIAQKEENSLFMGGQNPPNLAEADYAKCRRISFPDNYSGALPTDLRCPNLTTLILQGNRHLELPPTELLLSRLTSLRVLNLLGCTELTSVPTSMGQLRMLQFLSLRRLPIRYLGEEVCHLSELQFLDLSWCEHLVSLPSQIGQLKNLKHLNLDECDSLKMIPPEISELTSLSRLQLYGPFLSLEREAPASICSLTGLQNLTELKVRVHDPLKDGIMGTWSEMRHLVLGSSGNQNIPENLPDDMQNMKKLQTLFLIEHPMLSLPNCKFEHLETVKLYWCRNIRELSALEWLPNLKVLKLWACPALSELGIGSRVPSGYLRLEKLVLGGLDKLESLGGPSSTGVWDERTLPQLRVLKISGCRRLKRLPIGMEKLRSLCALEGSQEWWESIIMWEDPQMKFELQKIFVSL